MDNRVEVVHEICGRIRADTWAGINESRAFCRKCPEKVETAEGSGMRGCFLLGLTCYSIAIRHHSAGTKEA